MSSAEIKLSRMEAECLAARCDPMDSTVDGVSPEAGRFLDGCPILVKTMRLTARATIVAGASYVKGIAKLDLPNTTSRDAMTIAGSATGAVGPTAYSSGMCLWDQAQLTSADGTRFRILGAAIRLNPVSSVEDNAGTLRGGTCSPYAVVSAAGPTFTGYDNHNSYASRRTFALSEGCTARFSTGYNLMMTSADLPHEDGWTLLTARTLYNQTCGLPWISWDGLEAGTVMLLEAVMYIELACPPSTSPYRLVVSPYSSNWSYLKALSSDEDVYPYVTEGHSFKSFMRSVGKVWKVAVPFVDVAASAIAAQVPGGAELYSAAKALGSQPKSKKKGRKAGR